MYRRRDAAAGLGGWSVPKEAIFLFQKASFLPVLCWGNTGRRMQGFPLGKVAPL